MALPTLRGAPRAPRWTFRLVLLAGLLVALARATTSAAPEDTRRETAPLPLFGRVADFALVDQARSTVDRAALAGEPWVATFVFTRCATTCPRSSDRMRALRALADARSATVRLVTFSIDPEHDGPDVLRSYAEAHGADARRWKFLTGSEATVRDVARSFAVPVEGEADPEEPDFGIMHSGHLILVDERARIRGYYPSSEAGVEGRILRDLERLGAS